MMAGGMARAVLRSARLVLAALLLAVVGGYFQVWQMADHLVFRSLYLTQTPEPATGIRLIDIDYPALARQGSPQGYREAQGSALLQLAALPVPPRVVLLDIWISNNPDGAPALTEGITALQARGAKVYAAVEPKNRQGKLSADYMAWHLAPLYANVLDGHGHTQLEFGFGMLKYQRELRLPGAAGETVLPALPVLAAVAQADALPASLVIPVGDDALFKPLTHHLAQAAGQLNPPIPPGAAPSHVIVGSFKEDSDNALQRPGPLLLAWALSDLLAGKASVAREPLNHPLALSGLAALGLLWAIAAFALGFRVVRTRVAPARWRATAAGLALAAFGLTAVLLLGAGGIVLLAGRVIPVALPLACAALGALAAWQGARRWIANEQVRRELAGSGEERAMQYDVFVSYAHDPAEHKAWVKRVLLAPLAALRHADGRPYKVFFDEAEIQVGRQWKSDIELALLGSVCFVAVYSERYFGRPYCREEIELADQLRIEGRLRMFPVARTVDGVPERYLRKAQYIDARTDVDFMGELIAQIVAAVQASESGSGGASSGPGQVLKPAR